jgi:hypothetical protein
MLDWFGSHSPYWLDTLVRCSGIHNHLTSSTPFTPFEKLFLANGLNFICTPPSNQLATFRKHYLEDNSRGWLRFLRRLVGTMAHSQDSAYLPKFKLPSSLHGAAHREDQLRLDPSLATNFAYFLDPYRDKTLRLLSDSTALDSHRTLIQRQRLNHSKDDLACIRRLMTDASITIKPADKNLGMVLVDSSWYRAELHRMLSDTNTYQLESTTKADERTTLGFRSVSVQNIQTSTQDRLLKELHSLADKHKTHLELWSAAHSAQVFKYLNGAVTSSTCVVPAIYLLIKVHKIGKPLSGRPIVPSTHWVTTSASVLVDHLLQEVLANARIAHLVKDTKSLVVELENTTVPTKHATLVAADIASLYTNIDTKLGLQLVDKFLHEQNVDAGRCSLIRDLLRFVMLNSYLVYEGKFYHQIDGTAMGTPCAPPYANIVVYMLEKSVLDDMRSSIYIYRRFLDDIFAYVESSAVEEFIHRMNTLPGKLKFEFTTDSHETAFLDLRIHKGKRFEQSNIFDLSVHQKKMNLYLYIPFNSFHTDAMKRSFIQVELTRYIRNSSDFEEYTELKQIFYQRLRDRGYPISFLLPLFEEIFYADRRYFLWPSKNLHEHPDLLTHPPKSATLLRRLQRWERQQPAFPPAEPQAAIEPPVFVIPYSPLSHLVPTRALLAKHWELVRLATDNPQLPLPIIAYQSQPSLLKTLVYLRARKLEEARRNQAAPKTQQTSLHSFFHPVQLLPSTSSPLSQLTPLLLPPAPVERI